VINVHTPNNVVEGHDLRVRDAATRGQGSQGRETLYNSVGELVPDDFLHNVSGKILFIRREEIDQDDALELLGTNETVLVVIQVFERLSQAFSLKALHKLSKLVVYEGIR
jgi:hypothetical protein